MNEGAKTAIFGAVALLTVGMAWFFQPESAVSEQDEMQNRVGENVFTKFDDPAAASSMQIVEYDQDLDRVERFEVARDSQSKLWTLPSHDGYPADAADQVRNATTPLIGLNILDVVSDSRGDHELYGVVSPEEENLAAGAGGVGTLITFKDDSDAVLASLVIGKEVGQAEGQRYVRIPTEDAVYQVEIDTSSLTTKFQDWIEGELLGIRGFDITKVGVRDYTLNQGPTQVTLQRNFDATVNYDNAGNAWNLASMVEYTPEGEKGVSLGEDEALNTEFLNNLKTAVQDLTIVDVQRKPPGLASDLKADDSLLQNAESIASLQRQGFFAATGAEGTEIFASGGETVIGTEDGVDYVLRFGEATASLSAIEEDSEDQGLSRYLLVTAKLDESKFPLPELRPRPETVEEMLALEQTGNDAPVDSEASMPAPGEPSAGDEPEASAGADAEKPPAPEKPPADEPAADPATEEPAKPAEPASEDQPASSEETPASQDAPASEETPQSDEPATGASEETTTEQPTEGAREESPDQGAEGTSAAIDAGESSKESSEAAPDAEPQEGNAEGADESQASKDAAAEEQDSAGAQAGGSEAADADGEAPPQDAGTPQETQEELQERLEALQEEIGRENQRLIDERNEKIDEARKKVLALNARFSEWYYLVGDGVYQKLKISRDDLITEASAEGDQAAAPGQMPNFPGLPGGGLPPAGIPPQLNPN